MNRYIFIVLFSVVQLLSIQLSFGQQIVYSSIISGDYNSAEVITLTSADSSKIISTRLKKNSSLDSLAFSGTYNILIGNKVLLDENRDTIALYNKSTIVINHSKKLIEVTRFKDKELKIRGWVYTIEQDTIAKIIYQWNKKDKLYNLTAINEKGSEEGITCLNFGIAQFDKKVNMEYKSDGYETFFAILVAGILAN